LTQGFSAGKYAYFIAGEWAPNFRRGGTYSLLGYSQPSIPQQPSNSRGVSFSAVQNIDPKWGLFLRTSSASGTAAPIETSLAWGGIYNNPFGRNHLDQVGLGIFWDKTNLKAVAQPRETRNGERNSITITSSSRACGSRLIFKSTSTRPYTLALAPLRSSRSAPQPSSDVLRSLRSG
jgi:hypothetical protein